MKKVMIIGCFLIASQAYAQGVKKQAFGKEANVFVKGASSLVLPAENKVSEFIHLEPKARIKKESFANWAQTELKLSKDVSFVEQSQISDALGYNHYRLAQYYKGVEVVGAEYILHTKHGLVESMNGTLYTQISVSNAVQLQGNEAFQLAKSALGVNKTVGELSEVKAQLASKLNKNESELEGSSVLVLLPVQANEGQAFKYAFKCDVFSLEPYGRWEVFVDAATGEILENYTLIHSDKKEGTAITKYSGTKTIVTDSITTGVNAGKFRLIEINRNDTSNVDIETMNAKNQSTSVVFQSGGIDFLDDDNIWNNVNSDYDEAATDAHWGAEQTFDYFLSQHGRSSYDNKGSKLLSYVHINEKGYFNASWNGLFMVYGDGGGKPLTALDVCGHELAHGVTGNSARLVYARESGALNESFSDIFGNAIERTYRPEKNNWKVGEDFSTLRDMSNPKLFNDPNTYQGSNWKTADRNCVPSETNDQCGVHSNSGVQNFWFYLLTDGGTGTNDKGNAFTVEGIGMENAAKIAYRNLSVYLGRNSTYIDAAYYSMKAAADLFGDTSKAFRSTIDAWYAAGVLDQPYSDSLVSAFTLEKLPCNANETVYFVNKSQGATSYTWDFGDGSTSTDPNPSHKYGSTGSYNVKLTVSKGAKTSVTEKVKYITFYVDSPKTATCVNKFNTPNTQLGILNFNFAGIDYATQGSGEGQYMNFLCIRANAKQGESLPIEIKTPENQLTYARVWIDYNNDGTFDESELVLKSDSTYVTHSGIVNIPSNAVSNTPLRIRAISSKYSANQPENPCATVRFGQIEEYSIVLSPTSSVQNESDKLEFTIFPNPVSSQSLQIEAAEDIQNVQIFNQVGVKVHHYTAQQQKSISLNNLNLASGLYMIQVQSADKIATHKIVIK